MPWVFRRPPNYADFCRRRRRRLHWIALMGPVEPRFYHDVTATVARVTPSSATITRLH